MPFTCGVLLEYSITPPWFINRKPYAGVFMRALADRVKSETGKTIISDVDRRID